MKKLSTILIFLTLILFVLQTSAQDLLEMKKAETAPFDGVLMPYDLFRGYDKSQRALTYMIDHPVVCEETSSSSYPAILFGLLIGGLAGFSFNH